MVGLHIRGVCLISLECTYVCCLDCHIQLTEEGRGEAKVERSGRASYSRGTREERRGREAKAWYVNYSVSTAIHFSALNLESFYHGN
jgi:hypothetical protein